MSDPIRHGVLVVSVDLELDIDQQARTNHAALAAVTMQLTALLDRHAVAATWGVADPALSAACETILGSPPPHEVAVLGDHTWVGAGAGRARFARELVRRVGSARAAGLAVSSLVLRDVDLDDHYDLLLKQGLTAVRGNLTRARSAAAAPPCALRFGLWEIPASCCLPGQSRWWPGGGGSWGACRAIDRAAREGTTVHLALDAARLINVGAAGLRVLESVLRHAARRREEGRLKSATLAELAAILSHRPAAVSARSILHSEAA
jgi:hypothetical protein